MRELRPGREALPIVRIERAVNDIDPDILDKFVADVGALGARSLLGDASKVLLLRPEETLLHYHVAREKPDMDEMDKLGDYLEGILPSEFDVPLDLPIYPISEFHYTQSPGKGKGRRRPSSLHMSGRENAQVQHERAIVRELLAGYFNYSDKQESIIARRVSEEKTGVYLASARSTPRIEALHEAFEAGNLTLPGTVALKRAVIIDV